MYIKTGEGHYEAGSQMEQDIDIGDGKGESVWDGDGIGVSSAAQLLLCDVAEMESKSKSI